VDVTHRRTIEPLSPELGGDSRLVELAAWGRRLAALGVSPGTSGNMSCRTEKGFLITATGTPLGEIRPEHWVEVTEVTPLPSGGLEVGSHGLFEPSKDSSVHLATYRRLPRATTVFHLHPSYLDVLTDQLGVPSTATYYPAGTVESVREIERFLDSATAVDYFVLIDHGIVSVGSTADEAGERVERFHHSVMEREA
jgi:ribulose-5-phosphate 4-epimerase/fuculose-1-phosphate aldolase